MSRFQIPEEYTVRKHEFLPDINSDAYLLVHSKSGARIVVMPNGDDNKVFFIGFRTTPEDSTGVAHIIEHTVLCGSRDFPVKDPFIELAKGSLNTFLNAMTYPDKTVYPVASTNLQDFENLCHVYLDAVFYPNIYTEKRIFEQEGWHYEFHDGKLTYNGVVYNEMKGVLSLPDDVLERRIMESLYPDTTYAVESGGDPENIPELTYEKYLDFHRHYYHPSNSYIFLYGDLDMTERLEYLDRMYLSKYSFEPVDSEVKLQKPFTSPVSTRAPYSVMEGEDTAKKSFLSYNVVIPSKDPKLDVTMRVLDYCLCDAEGAPLREALMEKGIGEDVGSLFEDGIAQPCWSLVARNTGEERKNEFVSTVRGVLSDIVTNGFDEDALRAGINYHEFRYREADFGSYPKGLIYGLSAMDSWLYNEDEPWEYLKNGAVYEELKEEIGTGWFEKTVQKYFLDNPFRSVVVLYPEPGLTDRKEREQDDRLSRMLGSMPKEEAERIRREQERLDTYRKTPDTPKALSCIPMLGKEDLRKEALKFNNIFSSVGKWNTIFLQHPVFTNHISYIKLVFSLEGIPQKYYPYLGAFRTVFTALSTEDQDYPELNNRINIETGGIGCGMQTVERVTEQGGYRFLFDVHMKSLDENVPKAFALLEEIVLHTEYTDKNRLRDLLMEERSGMKSELIGSGHVTAAGRAEASFSEPAAVMDDLNGIDGYRFLDTLLESFDERAEEVLQNLKEISEWIFRPENVVCADCTADESAMDGAGAEIARFLDAISVNTEKNRRNLLQMNEKEQAPFRAALVKGSEAFETAGGIQFVCRAGNFRKNGLPYNGALRVLRIALSLNYLWNNTRVLGGAYGCMVRFKRNGTSYFVTYRDPHLMNSVRIFEEAADYVRNFDADERTMTQYIIGAVSAMDQPYTPSGFGDYCLLGYLAGESEESKQKARDEVLSCTPEKIRMLAPYIDAILSEHAFCVVGSAAKIEQYADKFNRVEKLK